jgi:hypothetical protein
LSLVLSGGKNSRFAPFPGKSFFHAATRSRQTPTALLALLRRLPYNGETVNRSGADSANRILHFPKCVFSIIAEKAKKIRYYLNQMIFLLLHLSHKQKESGRGGHFRYRLRLN